MALPSMSVMRAGRLALSGIVVPAPVSSSRTDVHDEARALRHVRDGGLDALARVGRRDGRTRAGGTRDAAVAAGFALQVVEPHMNGPGGDLPLIFWDGAPHVVCGQGPAPAGATIAHYRDSWGSSSCPAPAISPRAFRAHSTPGSCSCATTGRSSSPTSCSTRSATPGTVSRRNPGSCGRSRRSTPSGCRRPRSGARARDRRAAAQLALAETYERLARSSGASREARIDAARDAWYRGFVAEAIPAASSPGGDSSGERHAGVFTADDLAASRRRAKRPRRSTSAAGGVQDRAVGPGSGAAAATRAARGLELGPFLGVDTSTRCSSARSSRSPTARPGTATRRPCRWRGCCRRPTRTARRALISEQAR